MRSMPRTSSVSAVGGFRVLPNARRLPSGIGALILLAACAGATSTRTATQPDSPSDFRVAGDPESPSGATWTFSGRVDGVEYDLTGVLLKPPGPGPFPAVILSHGAKGSAALFGSMIGPTMRGWGLVCIAPNYTHAAGVPMGKPGDASERGASHANVLRAHMTHELLRRLGYVDMARVAVHGHSMGAYVDAALVSEYPDDFRAASSTGGGVRPDFISSGPAPSPRQVRGVRTPYQMHHGDADTVVPLSYDQRFDALLAALGVPHELDVYPGADHLAVRLSPVMLDRVHAWYGAHGMF